MTRKIRLLLGTEGQCSYLADNTMANLYADPDRNFDTGLQSGLNAVGFRRSGGYLYRPHCPSCRACQSLRLPTDSVNLRRRHRRILKSNADVSVSWRPAEFRDYHYALYRRYLRFRHADGEMNSGGQQQYREFLFSPWGNTEIVEFRYNDEPQSTSFKSDLLAVMILDRLADGYSAVYSFYNPRALNRSPGSFMILWLLEELKRREQPYLYLGYWISEAEKMDYKAQFRPLELFDGSSWNRFEQDDSLPSQRLNDPD